MPLGGLDSFHPTVQSTMELCWWSLYLCVTTPLQSKDEQEILRCTCWTISARCNVGFRKSRISFMHLLNHLHACSPSHQTIAMQVMVLVKRDEYSLSFLNTFPFFC